MFADHFDKSTGDDMIIELGYYVRSACRAHGSAKLLVTQELSQVLGDVLHVRPIIHGPRGLKRYLPSMFSSSPDIDF
jgi:hypothetical protein